jgi:hypothetical protein
LFVAASYLAVSALVRLMRQRRDELTVDLRRQMDAETRRLQAQRRKAQDKERRAKKKAA